MFSIAIGRMSAHRRRASNEAQTRQTDPRQSGRIAQIRRWMLDAAQEGEASEEGQAKDQTMSHWPFGCQDKDSCHRHKACMYRGCRYQGKDITDDIVYREEVDRVNRTRDDGKVEK